MYSVMPWSWKRSSISNSPRSIRCIEAPPHDRLAAPEQNAERTLRKVDGDDRAFLVAREGFLDAALVAQPAHTASVERRVQEVGGDRDPGDLNTRGVEALPESVMISISLAPASVALTIQSPKPSLKRVRGTLYRAVAVVGAPFGGSVAVPIEYRG